MTLVLELVALGSFEDATRMSAGDARLRYLHHFYDPIHGGAALSYGPVPTLPSDLWGLETKNIEGQNYSYRTFQITISWCSHQGHR